MMINRINYRSVFTFISLLIFFNTGVALAQTTAFTYQGKLTDNGAPASGNYDLTIKLFDTATVSSGVQQGATLSLTNVAVSGGVFTVQLDFGACASCFTGAARFLEIAVKPTSGSTFTTLSPRQAVTANPYAIRTVSAATADGLSVQCVSCVTSNQIQGVNGSSVNGAIPVASIPAGSGNYIQNTTTQQAASNFNISGDGMVGGTLSSNIFNTTTQYNIGGKRVLSNPGSSNTYVGEDSGLQNSGSGNTFIGARSGFGTGSNNTFIGAGAGGNFTNNSNNTLIGVQTYIETGLPIINATAIGFRAAVLQSNSLVLGSINGVGFGTTDTLVGIGTPTPAASLHVIARSFNSADNTARFAAPSIGPNTSHIHYGTTGDWYIRSAANTGSVILQDSGGNVGIGLSVPQDKLHVAGIIRFSLLGAAGSAPLCLNSLFQISSCSSSRRYKTNIANFSGGLSLLNRLRPVTFDWKESKAHDLGLVAEEVAEIEPLLVTRNDKGEIEGVKYDRLGVVLLNAIREQQAHIEQQQSEINHQHRIIEQQERWFAHQQQEIADLKKLVSAFPKARRRK